jgi:UDP-glucose 4-epimerase
MKALVAGGCGFIGSHLTDALLEKGWKVVAVDNFSIGTRNNVNHINKNPNFVLYEQDICDLEAMNKIFSAEKFDYVYHLAANSDIQASADKPLTEYQSTFTTTFNLLECMRRHQVKKLFFASTSAVYGDKTGIMLKEDTPYLAPISYYGAAKLGSEVLISAFAHMNDIDALVFRFPNVIGPRLTHGVIFDFVKRLKQDPSHLRILGDGTQSKPYMHVYDLIDGIMRFSNTGKGVTLFNIGVKGTTSVTNIADIICERMGLSGIPYEYTGGNIGWKGGVPTFQYDLSKIHSAGWSAKWSSDEAVALTVQEVI